MALSSFSMYEASLSDAEVGLFEKVKEGYKPRHTYEIINNFRKGRINPNNFNIGAYEFKIDTNKELAKNQKAQRELCYDENADVEEVPVGVINDKMLAGVAEPYQENLDFVDRDEVEYAQKKLIQLASRFVVEKDCDLKSILKNAVAGVGEAVAKLKTLMAEDKDLSDIVVVLLESGKWREACL